MAEKISLHDRMANIDGGADFLIECLCTTSAAEVVDAAYMKGSGRHGRAKPWMFTHEGTPLDVGEVLYQHRYDILPYVMDTLIYPLSAYYGFNRPSSAPVKKESKQ